MYFLPCLNKGDDDDDLNKDDDENKPITILVIIFQIIWLANETTAVNHKLDFGRAFTLRCFR